MSLTLSFEAHAGPRLRSLSSKVKALVGPEALEEALRERLTQAGAYFDLVRRGEHLLLSLHPAEERVSLWVTGEKVTGRARTNGAGPGYHAFVTQLLDGLGHQLRLAWQVTDPSGFWESRDRSSLEEAHAAILRKVALDIRKGGPEELWTVNFPSRRAVLEAPFRVLTPTGPWLGDEVERILAARTNDELAPFFPWWNELDGSYWYGVAQALRWMEVIWTPYDPPGQAAVRQACLTAFERSRRMDRTLSQPSEELRRLEQLVSGRSVGPLGTAGSFVGGYRLHAHRWTIAGRWDLELPGDFTEPQPAESGTWNVFGPGTEIYVTPYGSLNPSAESSRQAAKTMVKQLAAAASKKGEFLGLVKGRGTVGGQAVMWRSPGGELLLQGAKPGPGTFVLVTFMCRDANPPETWTPAWESLEAIC